MNRFLYIVFFIWIVFFTNPTEIYACGSKSIKIEKTCCTEKVSNIKDSKSSCNLTLVKDKENSCNGKCGNSNCASTFSVYFSLFVYYEIEFIHKFFNFSTKKMLFHCPESLLSDGFASIWLIPKIA